MGGGGGVEGGVVVGELRGGCFTSQLVWFYHQFEAWLYSDIVLLFIPFHLEVIFMQPIIKRNLHSNGKLPFHVQIA